MYHPFAFYKQDIRPISLITSSFIDVLVVGGGGAGGYRTGGGGGAGGYISSVGASGGGQPAVSLFTASMNTTYTISVGGGAAAFYTQTPSGVTGNGTASRLNNYYANGGGRGGSGYTGVTDQAIYRDGQPGGSGGGGGQWNYSLNYATGSGGTGSSGLTSGGSPVGDIYGYNGGSGSVGANFQRGGGGGGAYAVGQNALIGSSTSIAGANGGDGLDNSPEYSSIYRAGGGGGGHSVSPGTPTTTALGGTGGGGNGGKSGVYPGPGEEFKGGGGGGGGVSTWINGGQGGSGVVILRYIANDITASVTAGVTTSEVQIGGYKVLTVTAGGISDTITFTPLI